MKRDMVSDYIVEPCRGCSLKPPFSWKVCLQCRRENREEGDFVIVLPREELEK